MLSVLKKITYSSSEIIGLLYTLTGKVGFREYDKKFW